MTLKAFSSAIKCSQYRLPRDAANPHAVPWAHMSTDLPRAQHTLEEEAGIKYVQEHHLPDGGG